MHTHADSICRDLSKACERLNEHQRRLQDLLNTIDRRATGQIENAGEEESECA